MILERRIVGLGAVLLLCSAIQSVAAPVHLALDNPTNTTTPAPASDSTPETKSTDKSEKPPPARPDFGTLAKMDRPPMGTPQKFPGISDLIAMLSNLGIVGWAVLLIVSAVGFAVVRNRNP